MISPGQARAARALARLTTYEVAELTGLSRRTVSTFENANTVHIESIEAIQACLEAHGIEFLAHHGVRIRPGWRKGAGTPVDPEGGFDVVEQNTGDRFAPGYHPEKED